MTVSGSSSPCMALTTYQGQPVASAYPLLARQSGDTYKSLAGAANAAFSLTHPTRMTRPIVIAPPGTDQIPVLASKSDIRASLDGRLRVLHLDRQRRQ